MSEFNNRIGAQREILAHINSNSWKEELFGLSIDAIKRWIDTNKIASNSNLVKLIKESAEKLFFLSNKSQEQITEDYKNLSKDVSVLTKKIQIEMSSIK